MTQSDYLVTWTLEYIQKHPELTDKERDDLWSACSQSITWLYSSIVPNNKHSWDRSNKKKSKGRHHFKEKD